MEYHELFLFAETLFLFSFPRVRENILFHGESEPISTASDNDPTEVTIKIKGNIIEALYSMNDNLQNCVYIPRKIIIARKRES